MGVRNQPAEAGFANPVSVSRMSSRTAESASPSKRFLSTGVGLWLGDHPPGDQCPTLGPEGWLRPTVYCQCSKGDVSRRGSAWIWRICQITRRVASLCPKQRSQSLRTPLPPRSCALGSGDMMNSTAQLSLKRLAYAAIINCSAQEYDTPSTINDEGDHCENRTGLFFRSADDAML